MYALVKYYNLKYFIEYYFPQIDSYREPMHFRQICSIYQGVSKHSVIFASCQVADRSVHISRCETCKYSKGWRK